LAKMKPNYKGNKYRKIITYKGVKYPVTASDFETLMLRYAAKKQELESGNIVVNKNTTVKRWVEQWLEVDKRPTVRASTYDDIKSIADHHIIPVIGPLKMGEVKRINLQAILNDHAGKSFSLVSKLRIYLREIFDSAERDEIIVKSPARYIVMPETTRGTARVMTDAEYTATLEICRTHRAGLWLMTMLRCGLRPGETVPLVWPDIDFKAHTITVSKAVEFLSGKPHVNPGAKTEAGNRVLKIPDDLFALFQAAREQSSRLLIFTPARSDQMLNESQLRRMWHSFCRELDIKLGATLYRNQIIISKIDGLKLYSLRHTAITRLVLAGANVKDVQFFAGHADVHTTLNIYTQVSKESAADRILAIQNPQPKSVPKGVPAN